MRATASVAMGASPRSAILKNSRRNQQKATVILSAGIFSHARQASLGRCVMITRYWAGITSSRSEVSSPITCIGFLQHGQFVSAGATVS
jgi:hypothetical protein